MLTNEDIAAYLEVGNELRAIEFKGNRGTQSAGYIAKVARAALAMSNQRDGGHVILGVDDADPAGPGNGLNEADHSLWSDQDWAADKINRFADPPLDLRIETRVHPVGGNLVVIEVAEFSQVPTLCQRDSENNVLKIGQLYTRSIRKPESTNYHTQNEVRELLDLAVSKGLRRYIETGQAAGVDFGQLRSPKEPFHEQLERAFSGNQGRSLLSRPYFRYILHPESFDAGRVPYDRLLSSVNDSTVRLRGWPFPFVREPSYEEDFIYEISAGGRREEGWAMFMSGLFVQARQIGDWPSDDDGHTNDEDERLRGNMPVWLALRGFTEALEFATRLRENLQQREPMIVQFEGGNLRGQRLVVANDRRSGFFQNYIYEGETWRSQEYVIDDDSYVRGTRSMAVEAALDLIARFGWSSVTSASLEGIQEEFFDR